MEPIQPLKVVKVSANSPSIPINPTTPQGYDSRMGDSELAEQYRHYPLMDFFGLDVNERGDDKLLGQIKDVHTWVQRRYPNADTMDTSKALRMLEREIGIPQLGDTRLNNLWTYISIDNQIDTLEDDKRNLRGH